jgi:hypothetical protein
MLKPKLERDGSFLIRSYTVEVTQKRGPFKFHGGKLTLTLTIMTGAGT